MDRTITYTSALPRSADFLQNQKFGLSGLGYFAQAILGQPSLISPGTIAWLDGLVIAPVSPPGLQVTIGAGSIYMVETMDANPYGVLGVDTQQLIKQGIVNTPTTLNITPPPTSGYSQYYLVEAAYNDVDGGQVVLPYFNTVNPLIPLGGPANSGQQQFTIRQGVCTISLVAGVAAPTGTQIVPPVTAGFTPIYTVLVTNGQTSIVSTNIATVANAPFISPKLTQVPAAIQAQVNNFVVDTSVNANNMTIQLASFTNVVAGLTLRIQKGVNKNTATPNISINGAAPINVTWADGSPMLQGDWPANGIGQVVFNGSVWTYTAAGPTIFARVAPGSSPTVTDASLLHYGIDTGGANNAVVTATSPLISSNVTVGMTVEVQKINVANSGAMTLAVTANGGTVSAPLVWPDGSALQANDWPSGALAIIIFDGTVYRLMSVTNRPPSFPTGAYVHYGVASGTNTLTVNTIPSFSALNDGIFLELNPTQANTGAVTLAANGLPPASVQTVTGQNLAGGQFQPNQPVFLMALGGIWKAIALGGGTGAGLLDMQVLLSSGVYVPTAGTTLALVIATGGGAAGGVYTSGGGGGGAGSTAMSVINMSGIISIPYTIGAGGQGVTVPPGGSSTGGAGGTTTFGTFLAAGGGQGGQIPVFSEGTNQNATGGFGGQATIGTLLINGGDGLHGIGVPPSALPPGTNAIAGGNGGASFWGGGGDGAATFVGQGSNGNAYGSGGGGGQSNCTLRIGGNGAPGIVVVLEF